MELHPEGDFQAIACHREDGSVVAEFGETMKGKPYVRIQMEITEGETKGAVLEWTGWFTGAATKYTVEALRKLGFEGDKLAALLDQSLDRPVTVQVKHDEYNGKVKARVDRIRGANPVMSVDRLMAFSAEMENAIRANDTAPDDSELPPNF